VEWRSMDEGSVRQIADGRAYTGQQAEEDGLVDEVGTYDDARGALKDDYDLEDAAVIEYNNNLDFFTSLRASMNNLFNKDNLNLDTIKSMVQKYNILRILYMNLRK